LALSIGHGRPGDTPRRNRMPDEFNRLRGGPAPCSPRGDQRRRVPARRPLPRHTPASWPQPRPRRAAESRMSKSGRAISGSAAPARRRSTSALGLADQQGTRPPPRLPALHTANSATLVAMGMPPADALARWPMTATDTHSGPGRQPPARPITPLTGESMTSSAAFTWWIEVH